jgi:aryl sulfotransferase
VNQLVWLASYPKSGNTWFRMLAHAVARGSDRPLDINQLPVEAAIASARYPFEHLTLLDSEALTHDEADLLRPAVYQALARGEFRDPLTPADAPVPAPYFVKVHDAYLPNTAGAPLFDAARAAILIVRDPRAVAPSFASHRSCTIDEAINFMASDRFATSVAYDDKARQMRQRLLSWSHHTESWLGQTDLPVHLVRYEDLKADTPGVLREAFRFLGRETPADVAAAAARAADFRRLQAQEREKGFVEQPQGVSDPFFRRGETDGWREELTADQAARIEAAHGEVMRRLGYELSSRAAAG